MEEKFKIPVTCVMCGRSHDIEVRADAWNAWRCGAFIQDVMPELSASERELLISKTCGDCFDAMFPTDHDDDDEQEN